MSSSYDYFEEDLGDWRDLFGSYPIWTTLLEFPIIILVFWYLILVYIHGEEKGHIELGRGILKVVTFVTKTVLFLIMSPFKSIIWLKARLEDQGYKHRLEKRLEMMEKEVMKLKKEGSDLNQRLEITEEERKIHAEACKENWSKRYLFEVFPRLKPVNWDKEQENVKKWREDASERNALVSKCRGLQTQIWTLKLDSNSASDSMADSLKQQSDKLKEEHAGKLESMAASQKEQIEKLKQDHNVALESMKSSSEQQLQAKLEEAQRVLEENQNGWFKSHLNDVYWRAKAEYYQGQLKKRVTEHQMEGILARGVERADEARKAAKDAAQQQG